MKQISEIIKSRRISKNLSQKKLSVLMGCSVNAISMYEKGNRSPTIGKLIKLAEILNFRINKQLLNSFAITKKRAVLGQHDECSPEYHAEKQKASGS